MRAMLFHGPEDLRLSEINQAELKQGELRVRVKAALTGGTDVKTYLRGHPKIIKSIPSAFGYEFAGEVVESKSPKFKPSDRVVAANTAPCYKCFFCNKQEFELCTELEFLNGSFAEEIIIPANITEHNTYLVSEGLSMQEAACMQTLAVTLHGFYQSEIKDGSLICVYGIGAIGQCFIKICKALLPKSQVIAVGSSELKLKLAKENGADYTLNYKKDDVSKKIHDISPYGADYVFEAVGKVEAWQEAFKLVRPGGQVNFFGGCPADKEVSFSTYKLHYEQIRCLGSFHHTPERNAQALDLLSSKKVDVGNLLTNTMKLENLEEALKLMIDGKELKIIIE